MKNNGKIKNAILIGALRITLMVCRLKIASQKTKKKATAETNSAVALSFIDDLKLSDLLLP